MLFKDPSLCQLRVFIGGVHQRATLRERLCITGGRIYRRVYDIVMRRVNRVRGWILKPPPPVRVCVEPLHLKPGDWVRVKGPDEIRATLTQGEYERLYHIREPMDPLAGQVFRVHSRLERFYEECQERIVKGKNMVVLEGAYCDGSQHHAKKRDCDRGCLLFWKEAWLERLPDGEAPPAGASRPPAKIPQDERWVRVKSLSDIEATLDESGATGNVPFIREFMEPFCGRSFRVYRDLRCVYDEQNQWMARFDGAVVLDGAHCLGARITGGVRCERACSLFWHESWLERIS